MTKCLLCNEDKLKHQNYDIFNEICGNFTIKDAIQEYFQCSELILSSHLKTICSSCLKLLSTFHAFATKVNNFYIKNSTNFNEYQNINLGTKNIQESIKNLEYDEEHIDDNIIECFDEGIEEKEDEFVEYLEPIDEIDSKNEINDDFCENSVNFVTEKSHFKRVSTEYEDSYEKLHKNNELSERLNIINFNQSVSTTSQENTKFKPKIAKFTQNTTELSHETSKSIKISKVFRLLPSTTLKIPKTSNLVLNNLKISNESQSSSKESPKSHYKCDTCCKVFKTASILRNHKNSIHKATQELWTCKECKKTYTNKYILKKHMRKHIVDADKSYECYICKKSLKNLPHLLDHFKYKHDPAYITSSICHICSKIVTRLDIHLQQMHSTDAHERVKCEVCGHWMKKSSLKAHMAGHKETGRNCEKCGKFLKNRNSLFCHMKRVHTIGKFKCEHCNKSFHHENQLVDHVACQHTGSYIHQCRVEGCEKMFRNAHRRRIHESRIHPNEYDKRLKASYLREKVDVDEDL